MTTHIFSSSRNQGFTLIEIILVLVMLGIITGIIAPHFRGFLAKQQLLSGATFLEGALQEAFSEARSDQNIVGLSFDATSTPSVVQKVTCPYQTTLTGPECGAPRNEELLLWDGKPVLEALHLSIDKTGEILFLPPHGDILSGSFFQGDPSVFELRITHEKGDQRRLLIYELSGLIEIQE